MERHLSSATAPARAALHTRRAAAARRRALLTVTLLVLTVATGVLAVATSVSAWFVLAPAVLLVAVLVLGRRAVRANARADAAWESRERTRRASAHREQNVDGALVGRPAPVVRAQVTGRAVHPSQSHTEMIARVSAPGRARAPQADAPVEADDAPAAERAVAPVAAHETAQEAPHDVVVLAPVPTDAGPSSDGSVTPGSADGAQEWESVPVPRPVYTMKSAAPRWEPAPLTAEMAQITLERRAELAKSSGSGAVLAEVRAAGAAESSAVEDVETAGEPEAPSDSLGVNLNSVLARRRAAGE